MLDIRKLERGAMSDQSNTDPSQFEIRDVLFGDLPISHWPGEGVSSDTEPWHSFVKARDHLGGDRAQEAISLYRAVLAMPALESRHYLQAWHFLREAGVQPDSSNAKDLLGVVIEVALPEGLDIVAAYADGTARYFNHSGAAVIWEAPDDSLSMEIESLFNVSQAVVNEIGPWEDPRPPAPPTGQARINLLTPSGLHFGQGRFDVLAGDQLGGAVITAAMGLMQSLIAKTEEKT